MARTRLLALPALALLLCAGAGAPSAPAAHAATTCAGSAAFQEGAGGPPGTPCRRVVRLHACANAARRPSRYDIRQLRRAVLCLVNHARIAHGEAPLRVNRRLQRAAQTYTWSMAFGNWFAHVGRGGQTPSARMRAAGYISRARAYDVGENIGWGTRRLSTPRAIVAAWMASPAHRANILDRRFRDTAVGVSAHPPSSLAHGQPGGLYTQDFGVVVGR